MSWGFFLDLELAVPTAAWGAVQRTTSAELGSQWWGFEEVELEHAFGKAGFERMPFLQVFGFWIDGVSCVKQVSEDGRMTTIRLVALLDRSGDTQVAGTVAAMFEAASKVGGEGRIRLVNDGTYVGEDGVEVAILDGRLERSRIDGSNELAAELGAELEAYLSSGARPANKPAAKQPGKQPTGKPPRKHPVAKPAKKKPAAKPAKEKPAAKPARTPAAGKSSGRR